VRLRAFDGELVIRGIEVQDLFSPLARLRFDADVQGMSLARLSQTYKEWGEVSGVLNGKVRNFEIAAGEISSFDIELKTVKKRGVRQVASAVFIRKLVPWGGPLLAQLRGGTYAYEVMGLRGKLRNDYLTLRGAVRKNNQEFLMLGSGFRRLNVAMANIDRPIPFKHFVSLFKQASDADTTRTRIEIE